MDCTDDIISSKSSKRRNTMSLSDLRVHTPIVDNIISMLPNGDDKALKYAFFNVIALILAGISILALWAVYLILEPFIKSLLWALLCGSVLYPFKRKLVEATKAWLESVKKSSVPFTLHVISSPFIVVDAISDRIGNYVWNYWKSIGTGLATFVVTYIVYHNPPVTLGLILQWIITSFFSTGSKLLSFVRGDVIIALHVVYGGVIIHSLYSRANSTKSKVLEKREIDPSSPSLPEGQDTPDNPSVVDFISTNPKVLSFLSMVTWFVTFLYGVRQLPIWIMLAGGIFMVAGAVTYIKRRSQETKKYTIPKISLLAAKLVLSIGNTRSKPRSLNSRRSLYDLRENQDNNMTPLITSTTSETTPASEKLKRFYRKNSVDSPEDNSKMIGNANEVFSEQTEDDIDGSLIDSNKFLYGVFVACIVVQVWKHLWLINLLPIPVVYYALKKSCYKFGVIDFLNKSGIQPIFKFYSEEKGLSEDLFPSPVRALFRIMSIADEKFSDFCETYLDPVASCVILVLVVLSMTLLFIFAGTQVYLEGDHLVRVSVDLVNSTVSQHPEINQILPEGWDSMMGSMVGNVYTYGREYITNTIRDAVEEKDPEKAQEIEKQVIELWDKIYLSWNKTWDGAFEDQSKISDEKSESGIEWNAILETGKSVPKLLDFSILAEYAQANLGTLLSILESLWNILIGNLSVAISAVTSILSVVFGGGTAIVNLMINFVVFFTALFYLLGSSTIVYKPVEMFSACIPGDGKQSKRFISALEDSVNGVFTASFKMALFYGMWTWLIHTLFQINIVFVPSILAALFAFCPLLMHYWAAIPAILELSLIQGEWTLAILMMLAQMAPMSMVDTQIYSEIKGGGHPYLTGLAVAGGIFYFGIQGAIMGPVILCCVFVAVKVGTSFIHDRSEDDPEFISNK